MASLNKSNFECIYHFEIVSYCIDWVLLLLQMKYAGHLKFRNINYRTHYLGVKSLVQRTSCHLNFFSRISYGTWFSVSGDSQDHKLCNMGPSVVISFHIYYVPKLVCIVSMSTLMSCTQNILVVWHIETLLFLILKVWSSECFWVHLPFLGCQYFVS